MKKMQYGFTLIELMIVVAIIGILAAIALPQYQDYTKRTYVSEGLGLATAAKTAVSEFYAVNNRWPGSNSSAGVPSATSISSTGSNPVKSVGIGSSGVITITYGQKVANGAIVTLTPAGTASGGSITWVCKYGTGMNTKWVPTNCR